MGLQMQPLIGARKVVFGHASKPPREKVKPPLKPKKDKVVKVKEPKEKDKGKSFELPAWAVDFLNSSKRKTAEDFSNNLVQRVVAAESSPGNFTVSSSNVITLTLPVTGEDPEPLEESDEDT